ncbi:MAG: PleD family two-component system response regulator [Blastocatellales bacterium]
MKLRTLIVENDRIQAEAARYILQAIVPNQMEDAGLDDFDIELADCAADTRKLLNQAKSKPYDILLLDLGLPENSGEDEKPEMGIDLLKLAKDSEAARGIIVISGFTDLERYARIGADDFIGKPYGKEELQTRVLNAWRKVKEKSRERMVTAIMKESLRDLAPYAEKGIIYRLGSCFSRVTQSVRQETEEIRDELFNQYDLSPDDTLPAPLEQRLVAVEQAVSNAREEWKEIQKPFKISEESPCGVIVEEEVNQQAEKLHPCIYVRMEKSSDHATRILSFRDEFNGNAEVVIREILVGGLSDETDLSKSLEVSVKVVSGEGMGLAQIFFRDNFNPIDSRLAEKINRSDNIPPGDGQWRAWGLSVVQHIALRGGGRLIVEPQQDGNLITYQVTLAQDV